MRRDRDAADSQRGTCCVHGAADHNGERPARGWDTGTDGNWDHGKAMTADAEQRLQLCKVGGCVGARGRHGGGGQARSIVPRPAVVCLDHSRELRPPTHVDPNKRATQELHVTPY